MKIFTNWKQQFDAINSTPNFYAETAYIENKQIKIFDSYRRLVIIINTDWFTAELVMAEELDENDFIEDNFDDIKEPITFNEPGLKTCLTNNTMDASYSFMLYPEDDGDKIAEITVLAVNIVLSI